jgi:8-oxo-dGTP pyrophosphatase MutT (NUDIX family)
MRRRYTTSMQQATICYCVKDDTVLLGMKKSGFGKGKWNGFGGKVDPGETNEEAAARELFEESSLATDPSSLEKIAQIKFYFGEKPKFECHAYIARTWTGEPEETQEMAPQWFLVDDIPLSDMWVTDSVWLLAALRGDHVRGEMRFDESGTHVERIDIEPAHFDSV